jgi:hypothetical protein
LNAGVASTSRNDLSLHLRDKSSLRLRERSSLRLRSNSLSGAIDNLSILHKTLDHPVPITSTENSVINAGLAEIKVAIITSAAVIVLVWDSIGAVVAVDREDAGRSWAASVVADSVLAFLGHTGKLSKPLVASSSSPSNGDFGAGWRSHLGRLLVLCVCGAAAGGADDRRRGLGAETRLVDKEVLEAILDLSNGSRADSLLRVDLLDLFLDAGSIVSGLGNGGLLLNRADWAGLLVFDGSLLWGGSRVVDDSDLETELQLSLGGTVELLVHGGVGWVEDDEGCGAVGVTLEDSLG